MRCRWREPGKRPDGNTFCTRDAGARGQSVQFFLSLSLSCSELKGDRICICKWIVNYKQNKMVSNRL